jgi:hypothetical protein
MKGNSLSVGIVFVMVSGLVTGCALSDEPVNESQSTAELGAIRNESAFVLTVSTETAPQDKVNVTPSDGSPGRTCFGTGCQFAFLAGVTLTLRVPFPTDKVNCIFFAGWTGACAGQGNPCTLVLNSDLTTEAIWDPIIGCNPQ